MDSFSESDNGEFDTRQNWEKLHEKDMRDLDKKRRNWGKNRDAYYNSDTQFFEVDQDEETIHAEEIEIKRIQQEQAQLLAKMDLGLDAILGRGTPSNANNTLITEASGKNASLPAMMLSIEQRVKHVLTISPELLGLISHFLSFTQELSNVLPLLLINITQIKELIEISPVISLIKLRQQLLLAYCTTILYYLYLKTMGKPTSEHPVMTKLLQLQTLLERQNTIFNICRDKLLHVGDFLQQHADYTAAAAPSAIANKKRPNMTTKIHDVTDQDPATYYDSFVQKRDANKKARKEMYAMRPTRVDISSTIIDNDDRRGTGMKIVLNTGLKKQKSKKQLANSHTRHKLRTKHDKALLKRKSQVKEYKGQKGGTDYTGDGVIKKGLIRSIKL